MEVEKCEINILKADDSIANKEWYFNLGQERPRTHQGSGADREDVVALSALPHEWSCASEGAEIQKGIFIYPGETEEADTCVSRVSRYGESFYPSVWGYIKSPEEWWENGN